MENIKEKRGRKPLSEKSTNVANYTYKSAGYLDVPAEVQSDIDNRGMACKWVNQNTLSQNRGFHRDHWKPVKVDYAKLGLTDVRWGRDPDGYLIRGDVILCERPMDMNEAHKARMAHKSALQKASAQNLGKRELQKIQEQYGTKEKIFSGYDENEGEET